MRFASLLSGGFTTMAVINPPEKKLANRTSVCTRVIRSGRRCANSRVAPKTFLVKLDVLITYISFMTNNILTFVVVYFFKTVSNQVIYPQPFPTHRF